MHRFRSLRTAVSLDLLLVILLDVTDVGGVGAGRVLGTPRRRGLGAARAVGWRRSRRRPLQAHFRLHFWFRPGTGPPLVGNETDLRADLERQLGERGDDLLREIGLVEK